MKKRLLALLLTAGVMFSCSTVSLASDLPESNVSETDVAHEESMKEDSLISDGADDAQTTEKLLPRNDEEVEAPGLESEVIAVETEELDTEEEIDASEVQESGIEESYESIQLYSDAAAANSSKGCWVGSGRNWWFKTENSYLADGMYVIDGQVYAFDANGWMVIGWYKDAFQDWYYFSSSGSMCKGWIYTGGSWYYLDITDGFMYGDGLYEINGELYYFLPSGAMHMGWYQYTHEDGTYNWYYFECSGAMAYGWQLIDGVWYYLGLESGAMYSDGLYDINGSSYYFLPSGVMFTGWHKEVWEDGTYDWYYFKSDGAMAYGWQLIGGVWYYLVPDYGNMWTGWLKLGNVWYYMSSSGTMATGWQYINGIWYYFDSNGAMAVNRWIGNYYVEENGAMAVNKWVGSYFVGPDGCWIPLREGETIIPVDNGDGTGTLVVGTIDTVMADEVLRQLNAYRASQGLYTLKKANAQLQEAVNLRSAECAVLFDHVRPNGQSCFSVYELSCAENIAGGKLDANSVMTLWKNSAGHNANMLNTFATSVGIGIFRTQNGYTYCVQLFSFD